MQKTHRKKNLKRTVSTEFLFTFFSKRKSESSKCKKGKLNKAKIKVVNSIAYKTDSNLKTVS